MNYDFYIPGNNIQINLSEIFEKNYASGDDIIIISGSVVEGIGNCYSDIDIIVFCNQVPNLSLFDLSRHNSEKFTYNGWLSDSQGKSWSTHEYVEKKGTQIEINYVEQEKLVQFLEKVDSLYQKIISSEYLLQRPYIFYQPISFNDKEMIHRLFNAICINQEDKFFSIVSKIDKLKFCFLCYRDARVHYSGFKDCLGPYCLQDYNSSAYMFKRFIMDHMRSFLHLFGITNTKPKWVFRMLEKLPPNYRFIKDSFIEVMNMDGVKEYKIFFEKVPRLIDEIFIESAGLLDKNYDGLRLSLFEILLKSYAKKDLNHPQISRALAFEERFYSRNFVPLEAFFDSSNLLSPNKQYN